MWTRNSDQCPSSDIHSYLSVLDGPVCRSTRLLIGISGFGINDVTIAPYGAAWGAYVDAARLEPARQPEAVTASLEWVHALVRVRQGARLRARASLGVGMFVTVCS